MSTWRDRHETATRVPTAEERPLMVALWNVEILTDRFGDDGYLRNGVADMMIKAIRVLWKAHWPSSERRWANRMGETSDDDRSAGAPARELARVERLRAADVVDGTVCRWKSGKYTYVALYVADRWWITGVADFYGERTFTTYDFVTRVLSRGSEIAVVTSWEQI